MLDATQQKLFALARSARARVEAPAGAAVVDETGRTYNGAAVELPRLSLSALQVAAVLAASAGARQLHGAVVVGGISASDGELFAALGAPGAELLHCGPDQSVLSRVRA